MEWLLRVRGSQFDERGKRGGKCRKYRWVKITEQLKILLTKRLSSAGTY
jgi:hypothetical protein